MTILDWIWLVTMAAMMLSIGIIALWVYCFKKPDDFRAAENLPFVNQNDRLG